MRTRRTTTLRRLQGLQALRTGWARPRRPRQKSRPRAPSSLVQSRSRARRTRTVAAKGPALDAGGLAQRAVSAQVALPGTAAGEFGAQAAQPGSATDARSAGSAAQAPPRWRREGCDRRPDQGGERGVAGPPAGRAERLRGLRSHAERHAACPTAACPLSLPPASCAPAAAPEPHGTRPQSPG